MVVVSRVRSVHVRFGYNDDDDDDDDADDDGDEAASASATAPLLPMTYRVILLAHSAYTVLVPKMYKTTMFKSSYWTLWHPFVMFVIFYFDCAPRRELSPFPFADSNAHMPSSS